MEVVICPGGPVMTNAYVVADGAGVAVVIDVGFDPEALARVVDSRGWRVAAIVATHGHFDHVAGNAAARQRWDAPLWMHPLAVPVATAAGEHAQWFGLDCPDSPPPDRTFEHGDQLQVGQLTFEVRHTPGHSPGGVTLCMPGHAFVGDCLFAGSIGRTDLPHSDHELLMRSIREQLMTLPDETVVYPGHGETTTIGVERTTNPFRFGWEPSR
ncbi:MAG: MBL fold metallo-hydrolase [Armatimonadetes bacterium]|nr:MBL fold metallo-hydrolase [Armatimonadota bacterium]